MRVTERRQLLFIKLNAEQQTELSLSPRDNNIVPTYRSTMRAVAQSVCYYYYDATSNRISVSFEHYCLIQQQIRLKYTSEHSSQQYYVLCTIF